MTLVDYEHQALARVIGGAAAFVHESDECDLCDVLDLREQLHDLADCIGAMDDDGRCLDCARRVIPHRKRGCAMAIPVVGQILWLIDGGVYSLPFIGKALWLAKRRRTAISSAGVSVPTGARPDPQPVPPAGRGPAPGGTS